MASHPVPDRLVIATGADNEYFGGLMNLVGSAHYWCPSCHIVAYDLGLTQANQETARSWCNVTLKRRPGAGASIGRNEGAGGRGRAGGGGPAAPVARKGSRSHLRALQKYAWKPLAILEAVDEHKDAGVLWVDAGSTITGPLLPAVWQHLRDDGHFLVQGQDNDMTLLCAEGTFEFLNKRREDFKGNPSYSGNTVGFVHGGESYHKILIPWARCAAEAACIAPRGSSTANHRFDQSALSVIAYSSGVAIMAHTEVLSDSQLPCFANNSKAVWTSRTEEDCYADLADCQKVASAPAVRDAATALKQQQEEEEAERKEEERQEAEQERAELEGVPEEEQGEDRAAGAQS